MGYWILSTQETKYITRAPARVLYFVSRVDKIQYPILCNVTFTLLPRTCRIKTMVSYENAKYNFFEKMRYNTHLFWNPDVDTKWIQPLFDFLCISDRCLLYMTRKIFSSYFCSALLSQRNAFVMFIEHGTCMGQAFVNWGYNEKNAFTISLNKYKVIATKSLFKLHFCFFWF